MAGRDIFKAVADLPFRRFTLAQIARATRLARKLGIPAIGFDQYPGKLEPAAFSCWYGPIPMQRTNPVATGTGFTALAAVVTPDTPFLPRDTNPLTGHDYAFYWKSTNVAAYLQWAYATPPGFAAPVTGPLGDLFDPAIDDNGGGQTWQNFSLAFDPQGGLTPKICFRLDLYDRKRGRSITDGKVPSEAFLGLAYEDKPSFGHMRWDPDTEIEPRLYIDEVRMNSSLDGSTEFNAARVAVYLNIEFAGYFAFDAHPSGANYEGDGPYASGVNGEG